MTSEEVKRHAAEEAGMEYVQEPKTLYDIFARYNAKAEGDTKVIKAKAGSNRPDLTYLPWASAWIEVLKVDENATYRIIEDKDGNLYHKVGTGAVVVVEVTICNSVKREYYPVESMPMQSVKLETMTPTQWNKAVKRGLVKCLALFGLGTNLYLNEEFTEVEKDEIAEDIVSLIGNAESVDELMAIYKMHEDLIKKTPKLVKMFTARKEELNS